MKFENLYIECENLEQRDEVFGVCRGEGLIFQGVSRDDELAVRVMEGCFFSMYWEPSEDAKNISYQEFISKYRKSEMKQSIEKAMAELNLNRHELSSALGMSRPYITKMLTCPQSEKTQERVVKMIDGLLEDKGAVLSELHEVIRKTQEDVVIERGIANNNAKISLQKDKTIKELNQALEYKDQLLAKNEDDLHKQTNRVNAYKEDNLKLSLKISTQQKSIEDKASELLDCKTENSTLSNQVKYLKRENKDLQIHHAIVCVILIILVAWGFYV